jgi:hypothetical protein
MARKSVSEMLADFMREAACLVIVFGFLDVFVNEKTPDVEWSAWVIAASAVLLVGGIVLERLRGEGQ